MTSQPLRAMFPPDPAPGAATSSDLDHGGAATGAGQMDALANASRGMHWLTLSFRDRALEAAFLADYHRESLRQSRTSLALGLVLYAVFGLLDPWVIPDAAGTVRWIRFVVVCPLLALVLILSFYRPLARHLQTSMAAAGLVASLGIVTMTIIAAPPGNYLYYAGLLLAATFIYTFMRLRFLYAATVNLAVMVTYWVSAATLTPAPDWILANNVCFLAAINLVGLFACNYMERNAREGYRRQRIIQRQADQLATVLQKTELARDLAEERSRHDPLTGLHNRLHFREALDIELGRAARAGTYLAVIILDLDGFKSINDRHGHAEGDRVLRRVAAALRRCLRGSDIAARYGGEEFAVLLPDTAPFEAGEVAERLRIMIEGESGRETAGRSGVTASLGVVVMPAGQHWHATEIMARADRALYRAKALGRNRAVAWDPDLDSGTGAPGTPSKRRH